jgi:Leu/Phe-tRNA-protein transferase
MTNSYYWSDNWSEEFYIELAQAGFISTTHETKDGLVLLPELQNDYAILDFENLHISKKVKKLMNESSYEFCINSRFDEVIKKFSTHHKYNWLKEEYAELLKSLYIHNDEREEFKVVSFELISKESNELIAGEVGYIIGKTYTSLSGFSSKEKKYADYGTLQLVLLAQYLKNSDFKFWNLGHPHMLYKQKLGCKTYSRGDFLKRWSRAIKIF